MLPLDRSGLDDEQLFSNFFIVV